MPCENFDQLPDFMFPSLCADVRYNTPAMLPHQHAFPCCEKRTTKRIKHEVTRRGIFFHYYSENFRTFLLWPERQRTVVFHCLIVVYLLTCVGTWNFVDGIGPPRNVSLAVTTSVVISTVHVFLVGSPFRQK